MTNWAHRTIIVPANIVETVRYLCTLVAGESGEGMFSTALSFDGTTEVTHYLASGSISQNFSILLPIDVYSDTEGILVHRRIEGNMEGLMALLSSREVSTPPNEEIFGIISSIIITDEDAFVTMTRLGLRMI